MPTTSPRGKAFVSNSNFFEWVEWAISDSLVIVKIGSFCQGAQLSTISNTVSNVHILKALLSIWSNLIRAVDNNYIWIYTPLLRNTGIFLGLE